MSSYRATAGCDRPFVGLRPFEYSDRDYFFGREDELDALELQIKQNRFVTVVGRSGCGKSSLIRAGLRARLAKGGAPRWNWAEMHPGAAPIRGLALALAGLTGDTGDLFEAWADRFENVLGRSSFGLGEALAQIPEVRLSNRNRVLLVVDQCEELFQFANLRSEGRLDLVTAAERRDEATMFVRLLLRAMTSSTLPLHTIVVMRSDYLGHCAGFHGLPEAVSQSQFLVPGMTRNQVEDVIRKPVQLAGGQIDPGLVQRALNDTKEDPDQLPILQHAMMRCWERAYHRGHRPHLTIDDYRKVGGVAGLLMQPERPILSAPV